LVKTAADEHLVLDRHSRRNEGEGLDLAAVPDALSLLDLHVRGDLAVPADRAAVQIDVVADDGPLADVAVAME
jgi:hypothetical protein